MIKQTWFGRILCSLGIHQLVWGQRSYDNGSPSSVIGGCVRCGRAVQWDF